MVAHDLCSHAMGIWVKLGLALGPSIRVKLTVREGSGLFMVTFLLLALLTALHTFHIRIRTCAFYP